MLHSGRVLSHARVIPNVDGPTRRSDNPVFELASESKGDNEHQVPFTTTHDAHRPKPKCRWEGGGQLETWTMSDVTVSIRSVGPVDSTTVTQAPDAHARPHARDAA